MKTHPYIPTKKAWLLFDLANGGHPRHYVWWFKTKKEAKAHRKEQKKMGGAKLSRPQKWKPCE